MAAQSPKPVQINDNLSCVDNTTCIAAAEVTRRKDVDTILTTTQQAGRWPNILRGASCHHCDITRSHDVIGHMTIRPSIDDFLYVLHRNLCILPFRDVVAKIITPGSTVYYPCGPHRHAIF